MKLSADLFADPDMGQIQTAADWEIYTATPSNLTWSSYGTKGSTLLTNRLNNGAFTGSHAGLSRLLYNTDYLLRIRHRDNSGATNAWGLRACAISIHVRQLSAATRRASWPSPAKPAA